MKNDKLHTILAELAEEAIPSNEINLWEKVQRRLAMSESQLHKGEMLMQTKPVSKLTLRRLAPAMLAVIAVLVLLLATPQGRAFAQSVFQFFANVRFPSWLSPDGGAQLIPPLSEDAITQPEFEDLCGGYNTPTCTIQQVRERVTFPVKGLGRLPDGMHFAGATGGSTKVHLLYLDDKGGAIFLSAEPWSKQTRYPLEVGASAQIEKVSIALPSGKTLYGEYVAGSWGPLFSTAWQAASDIQTLCWRDGKTFYIMMAVGENRLDGRLLDKDGMTALAASLTDDPGILLATPQPSGLSDEVALPSIPEEFYYAPTVQAAEQTAGFDIIEPTWLPANYEFDHATYLDKTGNVCLYYHYTLPVPFSSPYRLVIIENKAGALPSLAEWARSSYEGWDVDPAFLDTPPILVTVRGASGEQAALSELGLNTSTLCGVEGYYWSRVLMWKTPNGRSFVIASNKGPLEPFTTKQELLRLAENLNGIPESPAEAFDPERIPTIAEAEALWGSTLPLPTETQGRAFGYAQFDEAASTLTLVYGRLVITIQANSTDTLENMQAQNPEIYRQVTVRGMPALYSQGCLWNGQEDYDWNCIYGPRVLTWFENGTKYQVIAEHPTSDTQETLIAVAESMR